MSDIRRVSLPYVSKPVEDLLMWRDPKKTGILFAVISGIYIYVLATSTPLLSLAAYTSGFLVALSFLWANFGKHIGWDGPPLPAAVKHGLTDADWRPISQKLKDSADKGLGYANRVLTGRDATASVVATLGLFAAGFLLARINLFLLSGFVTILAFTLPKVYEMKKDDIDHKVMPKVREVYEIAFAKIKEVANKIPRAPAARAETVPVSRPAEVPKKEQ